MKDWKTEVAPSSFLNVQVHTLTSYEQEGPISINSWTASIRGVT